MMRQVQILAKRICLLVIDKCVSNGNNIISRSTYLLSNLSTAVTSINKWEMACSGLFFFVWKVTNSWIFSKGFALLIVNERVVQTGCPYSETALLALSKWSMLPWCYRFSLPLFSGVCCHLNRYCVLPPYLLSHFHALITIVLYGNNVCFNKLGSNIIPILIIEFHESELNA